MSNMKKKQKGLLERAEKFLPAVPTILHYFVIFIVGWLSLKVPGMMNKLSILEGVSQNHETVINLHDDMINLHSEDFHVQTNAILKLNDRISNLERQLSLSKQKHKKGKK